MRARDLLLPLISAACGICAAGAAEKTIRPARLVRMRATGAAIGKGPASAILRRPVVGGNPRAGEEQLVQQRHRHTGTGAGYTGKGWEGKVKKRQHGLLHTDKYGLASIRINAMVRWDMNKSPRRARP